MKVTKKQIQCLFTNIELWNRWVNIYKISEMNLSWANLIEANLIKANLRGAGLSGANLRGANLRGANLIGAIGIYIFNKKGGRLCYAVENTPAMMVQSGCFWGSLTEFENAALKKYGDDSSKNYSAQINYLKSM